MNVQLQMPLASLQSYWAHTAIAVPGPDESNLGNSGLIVGFAGNSREITLRE